MPKTSKICWLYILILLHSIIVISAQNGTIQFQDDLNEETNCISGKCVKTRECSSAVNEHKKNNRKVVFCKLGKNIDESFICCSPSDLEKSQKNNKTIQTVRKSLNLNDCLKSNLEFRSRRYTGAVSAVNGVLADRTEFANVAAIGWTEKNGIEWNCGGTLITKRFVLTVAHCALSSGTAPDVVRLNDIDLLSAEDDANVQQYSISAMINHPQYKDDSKYHDIALIKLNSDVSFTSFVVPACLAGPTDNQTYLKAAGYGTTGFGEGKSNKLLKVFLQRETNGDCQASFRNIEELTRGIIDEQVCAKSIETANGLEMDTCGGDSGGPLLYATYFDFEEYTYEVPVVVGLTSFGISCGLKGKPSVYTNVGSYIKWIESIVFQ